MWSMILTSLSSVLLVPKFQIIINYRHTRIRRIIFNLKINLYNIYIYVEVYQFNSFIMLKYSVIWVTNTENKFNIGTYDQSKHYF